MIERILVPVDGSQCSIHAAERALEVAERFEATVTVLLASDLQSVRDMPTTDAIRAELVAAVRAANQEMLREVIRIFELVGLDAQALQKEGAPVAVIVGEVLKGGYDLVVMGSRGLGLSAEEQALVGSVTERVLRQVSCPVLVVK